MTKKSSLLASVLVLLVACSSGRRGVSQPTPEISTPSPELPTLSSQATATALAEQAPLLATLAARSDFKWNTSLFQDDAIIEAQNNEFQLQRKPFTLRIEISKPILVLLNVLDTDNNFTKIHAGLYADDGCTHGVHAFCSFGGMIIVTGPNELFIDKQYNEGLHMFWPDPRLEELGSKFTITSDSIVYERYVSRLTFSSPPQKGDIRNTFTNVPIEQFTGEKLYLVFLAKHRDEEIIRDDELQKLILVFHQ